MKRKIVVVLFALVVLMTCFGGCSLTTGTVDDLIVPPKAAGDNQGLIKVLEDKVSSKTTFSSPKYGNYRSSVVLMDIDKDGEKEAFAFYYQVGNKSKINMMLFKHIEKKWIAVQNIEGQGNDIYSIDFPDLNNDGILEIAVGWSSDSSKDKKIMTVYSYDDELDPPLTTAFANILYSTSTIVDFNSDGRQELLLFNASSKANTVSEVGAVLYGYDKKDNFGIIGHATMDGNVTAYTNIVVQKAIDDGGVAVYVDGTKGDNFMVTEVIKWDENQMNITAPLYDASVSATVLTLKGVRVATKDVNDDGIVEIPMDHSFIASSDPGTYLVKWNVVKEKTLVPVKTSLINSNDGYMFHIDDALANKVFVEYSADKKEWTAKSWNLTSNASEGDVFTIKSVSRAQWKKDKASSDYTELMFNGSYVYVGKVFERATDFNITTDYLVNNISIY